MSNPLPSTFGKRPLGHGVTAAQWRAWEKSYDDLPASAMPGPMPKHPLAKEIYVAGSWVQFQLEKAGVPASEIEQACCDVGTSVFLFVQEGDQMRFEPQNLWKAALQMARLETD